MGRYGQSTTLPPKAAASPRPAPARSATPTPAASSAPPAPLPKQPVSEAAALPSFVFGKRAIGRLEAAQIASQLGIMVDAGVPLSQALEGLQSQSDKPHVRDALQGILADVRGGVDLSAAIARCPYRFPVVFSRLLRAAEATGAMGMMLNRIAGYLEAEVEALRKLRGALAYPTVMLALGVGAMGLIFGFLLPRFEVMYAGKEAMLPMPTKIALGISHFLHNHWLVLAIAVGIAVTALFVAIRSAAGAVAMDWLKLNIPLINRMFRQFYVARSFQTMGTMVAAGVTIPEAVRLSRDVAGNIYFARLWDRAEANLQNGQRLADPLFSSNLIDNNVAQMVATGERSGSLSAVMQRVAALCESELQHTIKSVTGILEPMLIILLGGLVGSVVMAILLPVFRMARLMSGNGG